MKKVTNYERIKNMSLEEMAKIIRGICPYALEKPISESQRQKGRKMCLSGVGCDKCRIDWLNSEVDNG